MSWIENSVIYQILVDRFSTGTSLIDNHLSSKTSKTWMGGNLTGVIRKIKYLKKLGVNAVYLTPVLKTKEYHGYHVTDFYKIDDHFGNKKIFEKLVNNLHKNKIKIIFDMVLNHCSVYHPFFQSAIKNKKSKYVDWFVFNRWPDDYMSFFDFKEIPKFNFKNREVVEYLIQVSEYWVEKFNLDGYRMDHAVGPPIQFWRKLKKRLKKINKNIILIAEAGYARGLTCGKPFWKIENLKTTWTVKSFTKKEINLLVGTIKNPSYENVIAINELWMKKLEPYFDAFMDFAFRDIVWWYAEGGISKEKFEELMSKHYKKFKSELISLLSNHDFNRFLYIFGKKKTIEFSKIQFSLDHPALIYYGEESGLTQNNKVLNSVPYSDTEARRFMNWNSIDEKLFNHYKKLIESKLSS